MEEVDGAREYFKRLKIVEDFCNGDVETAKKIMRRELSDAIIIKGRLKNDDNSMYGLYWVAINKISAAVSAVGGLIAPFASVHRHNPLLQWKEFFDQIEREKGEIAYKEDLTVQLNNALKRFVEVKGVKTIITWVEENQIKELTDTFHKIISDVLKMDDLETLIDFESITSLDLFEETGIKPTEGH